MSEHYTIQTNQGIKHGPMTFSQLEEMAKHGRVKPMTMVLLASTGRWQAAASIPEIRAILKKLHPSQSILFKDKKPSLVQALGRRASKIASLAKFQNTDKKHESHSSPVKKDEKEKTDADEELYTVRSGDGVEYGPANFEEIKRLVKLGRIKATTMVMRKSSKRWHLAASVPEIRALVRKYNPSQDSVLDRIRSIDHSSGTDAKRSSTVRLRIKQPFWRKFFSR
jgi:hypothetical protein